MVFSILRQKEFAAEKPTRKNVEMDPLSSISAPADFCYAKGCLNSDYLNGMETRKSGSRGV